MYIFSLIIRVWQEILFIKYVVNIIANYTWYENINNNKLLRLSTCYTLHTEAKNLKRLLFNIELSCISKKKKKKKKWGIPMNIK
jgi:hypothetical protein